jgi:hypothetical protein
VDLIQTAAGAGGPAGMSKALRQAQGRAPQGRPAHRRRALGHHRQARRRLHAQGVRQLLHRYIVTLHNAGDQPVQVGSATLVDFAGNSRSAGRCTPARASKNDQIMRGSQSVPPPVPRKIRSCANAFWRGTWRCQHFLSIVLRLCRCQDKRRCRCSP